MPEPRTDLPQPDSRDTRLQSNAIPLFETRFNPETNTWGKVGSTPRYLRNKEAIQDGYSGVFGGLDQKLNRPVVFKGFTKKAGISDEIHRRWMKNLREEAELTAKLRSKDLVVVYDIIWDPETKEVWMVLEDLAEQGFRSLERVKKDSLLETMTVPQLTELVRLIAGAMGSLRSRGVSHRDFKPANIMYKFASQNEAAEVRVIDLELAEQDEHAKLTFLGTPTFASYENMHNIPENEFSDTFVLGIFIHFLLSGGMPSFPDDKKFDIYKAELLPYDVKNYAGLAKRLEELGIQKEEFNRLINLALLQKTTISDTQGEKLTPTQLAERFASLFPTTPPEVL